jgi:hypothetical protein
MFVYAELNKYANAIDCLTKITKTESKEPAILFSIVAAMGSGGGCGQATHLPPPPAVLEKVRIE